MSTAVYWQEVSKICRNQIGEISKSFRLALVPLEGVAQCLCGDSDLPADMIPSSRGYFIPSGRRYFWQAPITYCHSETKWDWIWGQNTFARCWWLWGCLSLVTGVVTSLVTMGIDWAMGGASLFQRLWFKTHFSVFGRYVGWSSAKTDTREVLHVKYR